jgi:hypothetical protein
MNLWGSRTQSFWWPRTGCSLSYGWTRKEAHGTHLLTTPLAASKPWKNWPLRFLKRHSNVANIQTSYPLRSENGCMILIASNRHRVRTIETQMIEHLTSGRFCYILWSEHGTWEVLLWTVDTTTVGLRFSIFYKLACGFSSRSFWWAYLHQNPQLGDGNCSCKGWIQLAYRLCSYRLVLGAPYYCVYMQLISYSP